MPTPEDVAGETLAVLNGTPQYFFGIGTSRAQSAVTNWQHDLRELFRATFGKTTDFTPHCLRDTFAVDLLQKGIPIEEVSKLLGYSSIKTTEKSYAPWVSSRQDRLDSCHRDLEEIGDVRHHGLRNREDRWETLSQSKDSRTSPAHTLRRIDICR